MRKANIAELKNQLSEFLVLVKKGETVRVYERSTPVAELVPIKNLYPDEENTWLLDLEKRGILKKAEKKITQDTITKFEKNLKKQKKYAGVLEQLLNDRRED
ncbi:MAG: type II toxin-antitoxin system prevent-host-death family antitoxin [Deltaproteobacteria bacterium]|nr:type II toxin-antitoxin system prevent-host-death family antitoxin [Deltaproteobacteria bacterium]